jgi:hypothetical protein
MLFDRPSRHAAATQRRRMASSSALTDYEADLTSKDRLKQKEAIRRLLDGKVKNDWSWTWPQDERPGTPTVDRYPENTAEPDWKERDEWASNADSDDEAEANGSSEQDLSSPGNPFRFDDPDTVGQTIKKNTTDRKTRHRQKLVAEMQVNDGVACFTHRRNAWTRARHVRRSRQTSATAGPKSEPADITTEDLSAEEWDFVTEIPVAEPILPPETPMRKGINEKAYLNIYNKVIIEGQTPFCPINLGVVISSCVAGWKRDGEWPPSSKANEMDAAAKRTLLLSKMGKKEQARKASTVSAEGVKDKGVLRRSLQKVVGLVHGRRPSEIVTFEKAENKGKDGETSPVAPPII